MKFIPPQPDVGGAPAAPVYPSYTGPQRTPPGAGNMASDAPALAPIIGQMPPIDEAMFSTEMGQPSPFIAACASNADGHDGLSNSHPMHIARYPRMTHEIQGGGGDRVTLEHHDNLIHRR